MRVTVTQEKWIVGVDDGIEGREQHLEVGLLIKSVEDTCFDVGQP